MKNWLGLVLGLGLISACSASPAPEWSGPELARRLGCWACHAHAGSGGGVSTPLDGVGARLSPADLKLSLTHPRRRHPGAKMPSYAYLRPGELATLLDFLRNLPGGPANK